MKVMILYANAGNGHRRAAEALAAVCEKDERITEVRLLDTLNFTNKVFQELYANLYIEAVKKAPTLWQVAFEESDQPWVKDKARILMHRSQGIPFMREVKKYQPDLCLCTHFMPADLIATMLRKDMIQTELGIVVTDYYVHATWLEAYMNRIYVGKEESRQQLLQLGFPEKRVVTAGIPVDPLFSVEYDRDELCKKHDIDPSLPMVLLSAGAFGVMAESDMAQMLSGITNPCHLVVVCGNNKKLKAQIEKWVEENGSEHISYHILGFTTEMHEWMAMAALFIGKPGGLSSSECLALGLPMVIWNPIPGQEMFNASYLLENGAAIAPDCLGTLPFRINDLLANPDRLKQMSENAKNLGRAHAARDIIDDSIEHRGEGVIKVPTVKRTLKDLLFKEIF